MIFTELLNIVQRASNKLSLLGNYFYNSISYKLRGISSERDSISDYIYSQKLVDLLLYNNYITNSYCKRTCTASLILDGVTYSNVTRVELLVSKFNNKSLWKIVDTNNEDDSILSTKYVFRDYNLACSCNININVINKLNKANGII